MTSVGVIEMVYPASPENEWMAERLKKELSSYRIPAAVQKKTGIRDLSEVETPALIVFCMPESVNDPEVSRAIGRFREEGLSKRIIALILGGAPGNRFPESLLHETLPDGTVVDREPLAANISAPSRKGQLKKLETEKLRIIASVLGVAFDDLKNRRRRRQMQIAAVSGAVLLSFAVAFLIYALSRVRVMTGQQEELSGQYTQVREAEKEAETQRDSAKAAFAQTIASEAGKVLDTGDGELTLLLCLELLPEMRNVSELTGVFRDALEILCGEGYVPVTEEGAYTRSRYGVNPRELYIHDPGADPVREKFKTYLYPPVPEELPCENGYVELTLKAYSGEQGCAVYGGYFKTLDERSISCSAVHFQDDAEKDYYLKDLRGEYLCLENVIFLPDGTFLGVGRKDQLAYRVRVADGAILPFFDEAAEEVRETEREGVRETESGGATLLHPVTGFQSFEGMDVVFGNSEGAVEVYTRQPFTYIESLEGISAFREQKGTGCLFGSSAWYAPLSVYTRNPFSYCCTLDADYKDRTGTDFFPINAVDLKDGRKLAVYRWNIYELPEGTVLHSFKEGDLGGLKSVGNDISSEGWLSLTVRDETVLWDAAEGKTAGVIPVKYSSSAGFYGPYDEKRHRRSASAYHMDGLVWEFRESARKVPEDLEGQITLAEELLQGRTLTKKERGKYHLK